MAVIHMNADDFQTTVIDGKAAAVVDFFATWCGPCKMLAPMIEQLAQKYDGQVSFCKIDIDENLDLANAFRINAVPTVMFFKDGQAVETLVGVQPPAVLEEAVKKLL